MREENFEPMKISLQRVSELTGESTSVIYDAINAGHLRTFLVGRRRFARPEAIRAWVDFLEAQSDSGRPVCYRPREGGRPKSPRSHVRGSLGAP